MLLLMLASKVRNGTNIFGVNLIYIKTLTFLEFSILLFQTIIDQILSNRYIAYKCISYMVMGYPWINLAWNEEWANLFVILFHRYKSVSFSCEYLSGGYFVPHLYLGLIFVFKIILAFYQASFLRKMTACRKVSCEKKKRVSGSLGTY